MNICEVKNLVVGASYEKEIEVLEGLYNYAGDCVMNGYLGSSVLNISYDINNRVEFESLHELDNLITKSVGAVLNDCVIIKQVQKQREKDLYQLYSWKQNGSCYTYLVFDSSEVLDKVYNGIKKNNIEFLDDNVNQVLETLGVSFDNVMNIKISQEVVQQAINVIELLNDYNDSQNLDCFESVKSIA